jgi:hypothetical protein
MIAHRDDDAQPDKVEYIIIPRLQIYTITYALISHAISQQD